MAAEATLTSSGPWDDEVGMSEDAWSSMVSDWHDGGGVHGTPASTDLQPYGDSSGMQIKVRAGAATVLGQWGKTTSESIIDIASNSSGNPRIDRVVVRRDSTGNTLKLVRIAGTPASSPSAPALTAQDIPVARVLVASGAVSIGAADVTDERQCFPVGVVACTSTTKPASPARGQLVWVNDLSRHERWDGSVWTPLQARDDTGWVTATAIASGWKVYTGGGGYPPLIQVRRLNGIVYLRGLFQRNTNATASVGPILTLPAGFRPSYSHCYSSVVLREYNAVLVQITAAGTVNLGGTTNVPANASIPLNTSFPVD